jgi:3-hydroxyacyl-[acyl-carrier-protein] dehydratase
MGVPSPEPPPPDLPAAVDPPAPPTDLVGLLPHRPPFRFVDAIEACEPGRSAVGRWRITGAEPWLAGHFPGHPVVPGVLQLEALAQVGAVIALAHPDHAGRLPLFGGVEEVRFRREVRPGDELRLEVEVDRLGGRGGWGRGRATVDGRETCTARLLLVLVDP